MIKAGIIGSSGYVAGELIRCLVHHPKVTIDFLYSHSRPGQKTSGTHQDLLAHPNPTFTEEINPHIDVAFLCLGHGNSAKFLSKNPFSKNTKIIDLSNDFRLKANASFNNQNFVYGLVELNKEKIKAATHIANPGCFATAIQLGILPLAKHHLLQNDVHIHAITGATGAGQSLSETSHFSWRNNNISIYKAFEHQHLNEITESVSSLQEGFDNSLGLIPIRGDFTRGIFASMYTKCSLHEEQLTEIYEEYYTEEAFTNISKHTVHLKQVVNTNHCLVQVQKIKDKVLITTIIDNLLKGAAGQAIQNMNLQFGWEETTGLNFKASYF